jgi:hypothetical protein
MLFIYIYGCGVSLHKLFPLSNLLVLRFAMMVMPTKFAIWIQNVILKLGTFIVLCQCKCVSCEATMSFIIFDRDEALLEPVLAMQLFSISIYYLNTIVLKEATTFDERG